MSLFRLSPPFLSGTSSVTVHMIQLLIAIVPALIAIIFFFGPGVLVNITLAISSALATEVIMLRLRNRPIKPFITDGSAIVTAVLFATAIPPLIPWWMTIIGILFAIIFAKHLFGGLGYNPFNPAMVAYIIWLLSFPLEMTIWLPMKELTDNPMDIISAIQIIFNGELTTGANIDTFSGATPLDVMKTQISLSQLPDHIQNQALFGLFGGIGWEWINIWFAIGGIFMIYRRIISWHIPAAMITALLTISTATFLIVPQATADPLFHLLSGGTMIGAFFIATDPVTASTTTRGRLIFGAGVGLLTYIIRVWGGYPDGIAFAVLLMNMLVPLIDYYTQPKIYGMVK